MNSAVAIGPEPRTKTGERSDRGAAAVGGVGFDWLMVALGAWLLGGLYLDGWAHIHVPALETFFTPWHAVLYSGYLAGAAALAVTFYRNTRRGASWSAALPVGYGLSFGGVFIFLFGGVADMLWHLIFGIENGVEGLVSPTHLALALGGSLMVTGPLRAGLHRGATVARSWISRMPMVASLTLLLSLFTFFTEYASPYGSTWVALAPDSGPRGLVFLYQSVGLAGFLIQPAVLMALVLFVLRSRPLPGGSLTLLLSVNVALMAIIHDKFLNTGPYPLIGAAVLAGLVGDVLLSWLRPSPDRIRAFRTVAFAVPALQYLLYFAAIMVWARVTWSVHLSTGAVVIAGGAGWLVSYLVVAPERDSKPGLTRSDPAMERPP
jgi:hypothetical protein